MRTVAMVIGACWMGIVLLMSVGSLCLGLMQGSTIDKELTLLVTQALLASPGFFLFWWGRRSPKEKKVIETDVDERPPSPI